MTRRSRFRIGVLVPFTNTNLEPDLEMMRPPDTSVHFTRIGGYSIENTPDQDEMAAMGEVDITDAIKLITAVRPDVILYGCTSATLTHGVAFDRSLAAQIRKIAGVATITAAGSIVSALQLINARNVGFASPYVGGVNDKAISFLEDAKFQVVNHTDIGRELSSHEQGELTPDHIFDLALEADHPEAEAIVLACTDLRVVEAIPRIETALAKPVISSNQAMLLAASILLGLEKGEALAGRIFDHL